MVERNSLSLRGLRGSLRVWNAGIFGSFMAMCHGFVTDFSRICHILPRLGGRGFMFTWINELHLMKSSFCAHYVLSNKHIVFIRDDSYYVIQSLTDFIRS